MDSAATERGKEIRKRPAGAQNGKKMQKKGLKQDSGVRIQDSGKERAGHRGWRLGVWDWRGGAGGEFPINCCLLLLALV
jgi:hypothetical protein